MFPPDYQPHYVSVTLKDGIAVVSFSITQITDDDNIEILGREIFSLVDQFGCEKIVLSMAGVKFITSSVLGKIITLHRMQCRNKGRLILCDIEPGVIETLKTSRLINYFETASDVAEASAKMA